MLFLVVAPRGNYTFNRRGARSKIQGDLSLPVRPLVRGEIDETKAIYNILEDAFGVRKLCLRRLRQNFLLQKP